jgi:preprotein translocase subunit SecD
MRRNYRIWVIPIVLLAAIAAWVVWPGNPGLHFGWLERDIKFVRGLDLVGGLQVLLEADLPPETDVTSEQLGTARDIIEDRVNGLGVAEPLIQIAGDRRILVELPGIGDTEQAVATIKETGLLEFIEITPAQVAQIAGDTILKTDYGLPAAPETAPAAADATPTPEPAITDVVFHTVMTGSALKNAGVTSDQSGEIRVAFELTDEGAKTFGDYTSAHVGDLLGIVLDKRLISAPQIQDAITTGNGTISGSFTAEEANSLAVKLRYGSLPIPLKVAESTAVGPTLGQDSLRKSAIAGIIGMAVVMLFMALYYRLPGLIADLALLIYATITLAFFKIIPVTLTLPGVAGFVLSIGVAVDANVLIFERMKEELRAGRTLYQAIDHGFSRAWPSIRDSNFSTLITCAILFWFGSTFGASIVQGFSLTLAIGVAVSLFTAITVTRIILHLVMDNIGIARHPRWFGI